MNKKARHAQQPQDMKKGKTKEEVVYCLLQKTLAAEKNGSRKKLEKTDLNMLKEELSKEKMC